MKQNSNVPAFLSKLWTLVEDSDTNEFITWSQNGQSFLVLDEQRFAKEILPKYFKHNNMASFVRQLNMYGFRKVVHVDSGIVKQERDGPVEFQHPFFIQGQDELLENIKRKVSATRPEEAKVRQEDISKILNNAQKVQMKQDTIDSRLFTLKRENEALWREITDLRSKHSQQQQVIRKIVQFIVTLVQNNRLVSLKRKKPLLLNTQSSPKTTILQTIVTETAEDKHHVSLCKTHRGEGLNRGEISDDIVIYDITENTEEVEERNVLTPESSDHSADTLNGVSLSHLMANSDRLSPEIVIVEDDFEDDDASILPEDRSAGVIGALSPVREDVSSPLMSGPLQLNNQSSLSFEDPVTMMDSILNESGVISQNINLLGKVELLDYLDSIDCTLEDFKALLSGRQFSIDRDLLVDLETKGIETKNSEVVPGPANTDGIKSGQQLVQYTSYPLMAFLDGDSETFASDVPSAKATDMNNLLESSLNLESEPTQSKLVRLEPLTEAEASEATLFYFCELAPAPLDNDMSLLDS
ncbi:PREDICTED: heat shock factor protein 2 isoform X3 [Nanorana parkeri]|uniref:heat shock factor protein 2 isoform X3 n=1 Tax=Nanorana parkeri TaxID=125878 RepID=UPI00085434FA|nr:PREDICTED: heat shock factor protein 2 isoform X3 [Nanorana parkeri]